MNCESSDACARRTADLSESDLCDRQAATREDAIDRRAWPSPLPAEPCSPACLAGCWICRGVRSWSNWPRGDEDGRSVGPSLTTTNAAARLHAIFCTADASQQSPFVRRCKVVPVFLPLFLLLLLFFFFLFHLIVESRLLLSMLRCALSSSTVSSTCSFSCYFVLLIIVFLKLLSS